MLAGPDLSVDLTHTSPLFCCQISVSAPSTTHLPPHRTNRSNVSSLLDFPNKGIVIKIKALGQRSGEGKWIFYGFSSSSKLETGVEIITEVRSVNWSGSNPGHISDLHLKTLPALTQTIFISNIYGLKYLVNEMHLIKLEDMRANLEWSFDGSSDL